ncbi:hypothetical protein Tco_0975704 [Tanacetum coccineum]|uniref:Uncharacterized protein n=1 Tax=Tanacetum coccineum TaxID=301880 RepID=A0ABQ5EFG3_9ASTR
MVVATDMGDGDGIWVVVVARGVGGGDGIGVVVMTEGDGSSSDEWGYYGVAGEDYEGPPVFDDDPYEEEIEHDALLAAATEISKQAQKGIEIIDYPQNCVTTKGQGKGNSKGRNTRSSKNSSIKKDDENQKEAALVNESRLSSANKDKEVENILANENSTSGVSFLKKHALTIRYFRSFPDSINSTIYF